MKVIFLDVDGVIKPMNSEEPFHGFNANCMNHLNFLVKATGAKIVLSTSWRDCPNDMKFLQNGMNKWDGMWKHVVGCTPQLWHLSNSRFDDEEGKFVNPTNDKWTGSRGHEIFEWLKTNKTLVEKAVILDDDPEAKQVKDSGVPVFFGECDHTVGITFEIVEKAIDFLNK